MKAQSISELPPSTAVNLANPEAEGTLDLDRVFAALRRKAWLITAITVAAATLAGVRAKLTPPSYSASFEILVQPPTGEAQVTTSLVDIPVKGSDTSLILTDQLKILTSPGVLKPVVEKIIAERLDLCSGQPPEGALLGGSVRIDAIELCYRALAGGLTIGLPKDEESSDSRIFQTQFVGQSPEEAQKIAQLIAQRFLDYGLESRQRDIQQGIDFLNEKLPDIRKQVDSLQLELQTLRENYSLITPEAKGEQLSSQLQSYKSQYLDILVELESTVALYDSLQQQLRLKSQDTAVSPVLSNNSRYQTLIQELLQLDNEIASASTLFLDTSPDLQTLKEQRQNLLQLLAREGVNAQQELAIQLDGLATKEEALRQTLDSLDSEVNSLAGVTREFTDLQRELDIATESLTQILSRRETLQIEAAQRELPWELITPPTVTITTTNLPQNVAIGLVLGLLLGSGVALLLDAQKDVIYTPGDLKRITPVPILGLIPHNEVVEKGYDEAHLLSLYQVGAVTPSSGKNTSLGNGSMPPHGMHAFKEAFRSLAAHLQRVNAERPIRSLVVSSADGQIADSTTAAYLAWAIAEMGLRVLLIDADFRFPHLHHFLELPNEKGLSNILAGELELKQVIKRSPAEPNLFTLTAGSATKDPVRLLSSERIRQFIAKTESYFDLVIYDAPPFIDYADASLIAAETSGLALVSQLGTVKSAQLEQALEKLWISKIPLVGLIAKEAAPKLALLPV